MKVPEISSAQVADVVDGVRDDDGRALDAWARALWSVLLEPGDGAAGELIRAYGPVEALRVAAVSDSAAVVEARARWEPRWRPGAAESALDGARRAGARLVIPGDPAWPDRLDDLGPHAPVALWVRGSVDDARVVPAVAIVGARAATAYGEGVAADLSAELAAEGVVVVSGAAYGIDGTAHRAALGAGGRTVAVLAGGVDRAYPRGHESLLDRIAVSGAVWSETPCGSAPTKWRFLARNRLIAGLADAVVVVEAGWRSGSLNTAAHAATLGRSLGAVPGPITSAASAGCHRILREYGATCVTSAGDVREMLGLDAGGADVDGPRTDETTRVIDALSDRVAYSTEQVARRCGLAVDDVRAVLGLGELDGRVRRSDGAWLRVRRR